MGNYNVIVNIYIYTWVPNVITIDRYYRTIPDDINLGWSLSGRWASKTMASPSSPWTSLVGGLLPFMARYQRVTILVYSVHRCSIRYGGFQNCWYPKIDVCFFLWKSSICVCSIYIHIFSATQCSTEMPIYFRYEQHWWLILPVAPNYGMAILSLSFYNFNFNECVLAGMPGYFQIIGKEIRAQVSCCRLWCLEFGCICVYIYILCMYGMYVCNVM